MLWFLTSVKLTAPQMAICICFLVFFFFVPKYIFI